MLDYNLIDEKFFNKTQNCFTNYSNINLILKSLLVIINKKYVCICKFIILVH